MHVRVEISATGEASRSSTIEGPSIMLGRDPACQLRFDGKVHDAVSWQHARIDLTAAGSSVTDLGSSNGTFVNGSQVKGSKPLEKNDVISLGQTGPKIRIVEFTAARAVLPTVAEKMLPGGMLTPPHGSAPLNVSSDSLPPGRLRRRRSPLVGMALGVLALGAVAAAGYVVFTSQNRPDSKSDSNHDGKDDADKKDVAVTKLDPGTETKVPPVKPDPPAVKPEKLLTSQEIYRQTLKSTGWILVPRQFGVVGGGTGALIDAEKRLFLTAAHVADGGKGIKVYFPKYMADAPISERDHYLDREVPVLADVLVSDRNNDLAVLRLRNIPEGVLPLPVAKKSVGVADRIYTVGNPGASEALWSYTEGSVRQVTQKTMRLNNGWTLKAWVIVAQFPINRGDSGGPVVNDRCELVGVNSSGDPSAQLVSNCIDLREIRVILDQAAAKKSDE